MDWCRSFPFSIFFTFYLSGLLLAIVGGRGCDFGGGCGAIAGCHGGVPWQGAIPGCDVGVLYVQGCMFSSSTVLWHSEQEAKTPCVPMSVTID